MHTSKCYTHTHTYIHIYIYTHTHNPHCIPSPQNNKTTTTKHTHTHKHTHTNTHTYTHTHTHTHIWKNHLPKQRPDTTMVLFLRLVGFFFLLWNKSFVIISFSLKNITQKIDNWKFVFISSILSIIPKQFIPHTHKKVSFLNAAVAKDTKSQMRVWLKFTIW